ncbi:hypothetical protein PtA15_3A426 [Puccinia triticina]|uniref:Uncharacterized protein n=1 Tax=Puccinia triticina TaxID=208348 RepID=A0ABY7CDC0_9BASI|nr:uncharacterized protein PtA15_3A426 [Puccinia triticina]WAQ83059.1 hypothetical protein PtA15_3A426 [Puccinia triticina]
MSILEPLAAILIPEIRDLIEATRAQTQVTLALQDECCVSNQAVVALQAKCCATNQAVVALQEESRATNQAKSPTPSSILAERWQITLASLLCKSPLAAHQAD